MAPLKIPGSPRIAGSVSTSVPEGSTWAYTLAGLGLLGALRARRRR